MTSSILDFFIIGPGPSCEHSVAPMRLARRFADELNEKGHAARVERLHLTLSGSMAAPDHAAEVRTSLLLGLEGHTPQEIEVASIPAHLAGIRSMRSLRLPCGRVLPFDEKTDIAMKPSAPNGLRIEALERNTSFLTRDGSSEDRAGKLRLYPFRSGGELARLSRESGHSISELMLRHETTLRTERETRDALLRVWKAMQQSVQSGCGREEKPANEVASANQAPWLHRELHASHVSSLRDPLSALDWVSLWAIAVSEENAGGGRVVAVPTNETCGILPAVLHYLVHLRGDAMGEQCITRFLLTAGALACVCAAPAIAAGVETSLGCAMASAALCEALGGSTDQVLTAAALGLESHRGTRFTALEFPAIGEPNAIAAVTAINTARIARRTRNPDICLLDRVIAGLQHHSRTGDLPSVGTQPISILP